MSELNEQLLLDWLDALSLLQTEARAPARSIFEVTRIELMPAPKHTLHFVQFKNGIAHIQLHPLILEWPRIERVEPLVWMGLEIWKYITRDYEHPMKWQTCHQWAALLGCDYSNSINPDERWRWIGSLVGYTRKSLPIQKFEDRDTCEWCSIIMPTNSRSENHPAVHRQCEDHMNITFKALTRAAKAGKLDIEVGGPNAS